MTGASAVLSIFGNPLRHQLPARSPLSAAAVLGGLTATVRALTSGGSDPSVALEALLREQYGAQGVQLLGSGTQALTLALEVARALADREAPVALPAYSCFDVATAAVGARCPVLFYDVDPATLGPDPDSLEGALARGARVVVVAPLFGIPVDWGGLEPSLQRWDPVIVEDAAQGHGARWKGEPVGSRGRLAVLSFGRGKGWTGGGGGGALLVRDPAAAEALEERLEREGRPPAPGPAGSLRSLAAGTLVWGLARPGVYRLPRSVPVLGLGETRYREPRAPTGPTAGAVGALLASRHLAESEVEVRRRHAAEYRAALAGRAPRGLATVPEGGEAGWLRFPLRLPGGLEGFTRPDRARRLGAEAGYPQTLARLAPLGPLVRNGEGPEGGRTHFPGAEELAATLVTLPTHSRTRELERRELVELVGPSPERG